MSTYMDTYDKDKLDALLGGKVDYESYVETRHFISTDEGYEYSCKWWVRIANGKPIYVRLVASMDGYSCDHVYSAKEIEDSFDEDRYSFYSNNLLSHVSAWSCIVSVGGTVSFDDDGDEFTTETSKGFGPNLNATTRNALAKTMTGGEVTDMTKLFSSLDSETDPELTEAVLNNPVLERSIVKVANSLFEDGDSEEF